MENLLPIIIIGAIILYIIYTVMKNQSQVATDPDNRDYRTRGDERPRYNDPKIRGQGTFGRDKADRYEDDDDDAVPVWMEKERERETRQSQRPAPVNSGNDDPDIKGRGGFGRDKR